MFVAHLPIFQTLTVAMSLTGAGCVDDHGPRLTAVTPVAAGRGDTVSITGTRLCGPEGDCANAGGEVQVGTMLPAIIATVVLYTDIAAQVQIPDTASIGTTSLVVVVDDRSSNDLAFEVLP